MQEHSLVPALAYLYWAFALLWIGLGIMVLLFGFDGLFVVHVFRVLLNFNGILLIRLFRILYADIVERIVGF